MLRLKNASVNRIKVIISKGRQAPCIRQQFSHSLHGFRTQDAICYFMMQKFLSVGLILRIAVSANVIMKGYLFNKP
ncbi:hypothetical protein DN310_22950 [Salmonella enterica subsp. salamae]|uniref:Uncharacterized protein n=2 Tax=Salmonella enterica TaxID=28901 RepID=A0A3I8FYN8_SALER|nr:hypothetical protein [Salmonella enterica subsp. salamae]KKA53585.1 hypothetical protein TM63_02355 [Salmonella enterica subsp. salamae serovar 42:f,g,t:--]MER45094.1 hypothetical protein [Salmonella enterica]